MTDISADEQHKQEGYRDARITGTYDSIWQSVGKCVFCDLRDKYVFYEENGIVMTIALYAYIDGHFMVVPKRHVRSVKELTAAEWETMRKLFYIAKKLIRKIHGVKGMQIVQKDGADAQSTVEHIHFHCVPFDSPDLSTWNYRQLSKTPLENADLYKSKRNSIAKLSQRFAEKYADE
jgi:histidine triad (HIT) family protein